MEQENEAMTNEKCGKQKGSEPEGGQKVSGRTGIVSPIIKMPTFGLNPVMDSDRMLGLAPFFF